MIDNLIAEETTSELLKLAGVFIICIIYLALAKMLSER